MNCVFQFVAPHGIVDRYPYLEGPTFCTRRAIYNLYKTSDCHNSEDHNLNCHRHEKINIAKISLPFRSFSVTDF
jgi:hypothetical protein